MTRHELAHWYMLEKLSQVRRAHHRAQYSLPPLWFIEGLAEYCSTRWDADAEGLLRDAVTSGEALPLTESGPITGSVLMYKEGQSFLLHLAARFGDARIFDLLEDWWRGDDFETVYRLTFGEPVEKHRRAVARVGAAALLPGHRRGRAGEGGRAAPDAARPLQPRPLRAAQRDAGRHHACGSATSRPARTASTW